MQVLPEIHSLDDYEEMDDYTNISSVLKDAPGTNISAYKVGVYDEFTKEIEYGILYYNGHGLQLEYEDESSTQTVYDKFKYCIASNVDVKKRFICVNDIIQLSFSDENDFNLFLNYIDLFNRRIENFLDAAIDKTSKIFFANHNNYIVSTAFDDLTQEIEEEFFTDERNYFIMLHYFTFSDDIVRRYVDFTQDDTCSAFQILKSDQEYSSIISSVMNTINDMVYIIKSNIEIDEKYVKLYLYLSLIEKLIEKYSIIWVNKYDNTYDGSDLKNYLIYCANKRYITLDDNRSVFSFACFWLKTSKNKNVDIRNVISKIKSTVELKDRTTKKGNTLGSHKEATPNATPIEVNISSYDKLNSLIGLSSIKNDVNNMINLVKMQIKRKEQGLKTVPVSLHMVFTGNPGTGKTTIARILADIYREVGVLSKGQLVEVDRSGLVAGYVGQTAIKTQEKINEALGGILFIDEAYTLVKDGQDFGQEAIDTLLKAMEDHRDDFIVIVAGYTDLMQKFINSNPGLKSRFNKYVEFPDYSAEELIKIFYSMCNEYQYTLTSDADKTLREILFEMERNKDANFANARDVRNLFEMVITKQATRLSNTDSTNIMGIDSCDFI